MSGLDFETLRPIDNLDHALQSVWVILTTPIGTRVMRRQFGCGAIGLLGRALTPRTVAAWKQLVATAIDLWEPRFRVRRVELLASAEELRRGSARLSLNMDYRPRAHLGDLSVVSTINAGLNVSGFKPERWSYRVNA